MIGIYVVECPICKLIRQVKSYRKTENGVRKCRSCSKKDPNSTRSRKTVTCPNCNCVTVVKRSTSTGMRRCRSCSSVETNKRTNCSSKAGKIGGRRTADLGKLQMLATPFAHTPAAEKRRFDTLKRKGLLFTSAPENRLYELLVEKFGSDNIQHHVVVQGFRIDFYVKSKDTYVQLDGVYWHGLNLPYEQLVGTPKSKFDRDRLCDQLFAKHGFRLIRITDKELKVNENEAIQRI